jgi:hypothetical protein
MGETGKRTRRIRLLKNWWRFTITRTGGNILMYSFFAAVATTGFVDEHRRRHSGALDSRVQPGKL